MRSGLTSARTRGMALLWLVAALLHAVEPAAAQTTGATIRGRVTDAAVGSPISGAVVTILAPETRTRTSEDGRYTFRGVAAGRLQIRVVSIGYGSFTQDLEVGATGDYSLDFALRRSVVMLDELVTTATGEQSRKSVANVITTIQTDSIAKIAAVTSVDQILTSRVPGVTIIPGYGMTGGTFNVRIRGINSMALSNEPLWIIDGVRLETRGFDASGNVATGNQGLSAINPEDIESLDVIKGPSASAMYGTQASNGVIVIKTKRGRPGPTVWNTYGEYGTVEQPANWSDNYRSWGRSRSASGVIGTTPIQCRISNAALGTCVIDSLTTFNPLRNPETTPFGEKGNRYNVGLQASGGNDAVRFFASLEKESETGPYTMPKAEIDRITTVRGSAPTDEQVYPNKLDQINLRGNFTAKLAPTVDLSISSAYTTRSLQTPFNASYFQGIQTQAVTAPGFRTQFNGYAAQHLGDMMSLYQPTNEQRVVIGTNIGWAPLSWLGFRLTTGLDRSFGNSYQFAGVGEGPNGGWGTGLVGQGGGKYISKDVYFRTTSDLLTTAAWSPTAKITTKTALGVQYNTDATTYVDTYGYMLSPGATSTNSGSVKSGSEARSEGKQLGIYLDEMIAWDNRIFLTAGVRSDQSSAFGVDYKRAYYPRFGLSWMVSEEGFFPRGSFLSDLRVRAAWGQSGIQPGPTTALQTLSASSVVVANQALPTLRLSSLGNTDIKPEVVTETEFGFELGLWRQRVMIEATYYTKTSKDAIGSLPLPPSLGASTTQTVNISSVRNRGFEGALDANIFQDRAFSWNFRLTGATLENEILDMGDLPQPFGTTRNAEGYPIGGLWQRPITGYADANGDGILTATEITSDTAWKFLGPTLPTLEAGLTNTFGFFQNALSIMAMLDYRSGQWHQWSAEADRCNGGNCRAVNDPTASLADQAAAVARTSSLHFNTLYGYIKPADFLRLREVSVTYRLPDVVTRFMRSKGGSVVVAGRNLLMLNSDYPGLDPEAGGQTSEFNWQPPPLRYFIARINLTF